MNRHLYISAKYYNLLLKDNALFFDKENINVSLVNNGKLLSKEANDSLAIVLLEEGHILLTKDSFNNNGMLALVLVDEPSMPKCKLNKLLAPVIYDKRLSIPVDKSAFVSLIDEVYLFLATRANKASLNRRLAFKEAQLDAINKIASLLSSNMKYKKLIQNIIDISAKLMSCDSIAIYHILTDNSKTGLIRCIFPTEDEFKTIDTKTLSGYVGAFAKPLNLSYKEDIEKYSLDAIIKDVKTVLAVPIKNHKANIIGVIEFINKASFDEEPARFSSLDIECALSLAPQISMLLNLRELRDRQNEIVELTKVGEALLTQRQHSKLLEFILAKSIDITNCDGGTIYLVEKDDKGNSYLRFSFSALSSILKKEDITMPVDNNSISGYVALTKKVLNITDAYSVSNTAEYKLNLDYDKKHNYKTKTMLVVPMTNQKNDVIGVIQLINKKISKNNVPLSMDNTDKMVIPFLPHDRELITAIAGQAAVAIENNILYNEITAMLEGFVKASVTAIESRDPTTSGHSERVALYTVELSKVVDRIKSGKWKDIKFSKEQITEIRYASLLHDFGKVGVKENVLVKSKKLYSGEVNLISSRFNFIRRTLQYESSQRKIKYLLEQSREQAVLSINEEDLSLKKELEEIDKILQIIIKTNNPLVVEQDIPKIIGDIAKMTYKDLDNREKPFITNKEASALSIRRGSLGIEEREEIQSHVTHTFEFLVNIPWSKELKNLPKIAYAHHEKLNGEGYPRGLKSSEIPIQSKIMTVSDIYDALIARDRPYKRSLNLNMALDILLYEVESNHVDKELVNIFIESKIYNMLNRK